MNYIRHTRGFPFRYIVKNDVIKLIFINNLGKYEVTDKDGDALVCSDTEKWNAGKYTYQLQSDSGVVEQGEMIVLQNLALADSTNYKSYWKTVLEAVDAMLAGRATQEQKQVTAGDKKIEYLTIDELLKYREFVLGKVAEEEAEEGSSNAVNPSDQQYIRINWRSL